MTSRGQEMRTGVTVMSCQLNQPAGAESLQISMWVTQGEQVVQILGRHKVERGSGSSGDNHSLFSDHAMNSTETDGHCGGGGGFA